MSGSVTVVITGADHPTGLTTARALRGLDVDIVGIAERPTAAPCQATVWTRIIAVNGAASTQLDQLIELVEAGTLPNQSILFLSQDAHVIEASRRLSSLTNFFVVPIPPHPIVDLLMDKTRFHEWASDLGFAVPNSCIVSTPIQAIAALEKVCCPCILKPLVRTAKWEEKHTNRKFFSIQSRSELEHVLSSQAPFDLAERYVLQEWIKGADSDVFFVLFAVAPDGKILAIQGGRKVWQWPPLGGSTALCSTYADTDLIEKAKAMVAASGLVGLASVEFKRDSSTGRFLITEPTIGRNDYQSGLANVSSENPTRLLVEYLLDKRRDVYPSINPHRALWVDEISCLRRIRSEGILRSVWELLVALLKARRVTLLLGAPRDWRPLKISLAALRWGGRK